MVSVPGTANPRMAVPSNPIDGTVPPFLSVVGVSSITFNNTGFFAHGTGAGQAATSPDGGSSVPVIPMGPLGGISGWNYRLNSLVGVFLNPTNVGPAPAALPAVMNFTAISPLLGQVFFIGDGLTGTGSGTRQQFMVPVGATRLYFAAIDAGGWSNNYSGTVTVDATMGTVVPEPSSFAIMGLGLIGMVGYGWRRRLKAA